MNTSQATCFTKEDLPDVHQWNLSVHSRSGSGRLLADKMAESISRHHYRNAIEHNGTLVTYAEFGRRIELVAVKLSKMGVQEGHVVAFSCKDPVSALIVMIATSYVGGVFVPIAFDSPIARQEYVVTDSGCCLYVHDHDEAIAFCDWTVHFDDLIDEQKSNYPQLSGALPHPDASVCYMIYTSGSTGKPKGVYVYENSVLNVLETMQDVRALPAGFNASLWTTFSFDVSIYEIFSSLLFGGCLHIVPENVKYISEELFEWMDQHTIHSAYLPPFFIEDFAQYLQTGHSDLQLLLVGVEPLSQRTLWNIKEQIGDIEIVNGYGPTECTVFCTYYLLTEQGQTPDLITPIGGPVKGAKLFVVTDENQLCDIGECGELLVGGSPVAEGYTHQDVTRKHFVTLEFNGQLERVYRTGDEVRILDNGMLQFVGRKDDQVKIRGKRVELGEINAVYRKSPHVREAFTVLGEYEAGIKCLVTYCTVRTDNKAVGVKGQIEDDVAQFLPPQIRPEYTVLIDAFPLTSNGKIDKTRLPSPVQLDEREPVSMTVEEQQLANLIKDAISVNVTAPDTPFVNYMIDSIRSIKLVAKINRQYGTHFDAYATSGNMTLALLADQIREAAATPEAVVKTLGDYVSEDSDSLISLSQERYYDFYENNDVNDNFAIIYKLTGAIDVDRLEQAIARIVTEQEPLRTLFVRESPDSVMQYVKENNFALRRATLENETLREFFEDKLNYPFDYASEDLFRVALVEEHDRSCLYLMINMPDIIFDGWSKMVFQRDLTNYYAAPQPVEKNRPDKVNYQAFSRWERAFITGACKLEAENFWHNHFASMKDTFVVPYDQMDKSIDINTGGIVSYVTSKADMERLKALCAETKTTPFYVIYTILAAALNQLYGITDFCTMSPVANRRQGDTHNLMGCFLNRIILRLQYNPALSLKDNINKTKPTLAGCFSYDYFPYQDIMAAFKKATGGKLQSASTLLIGGQMMHADDLAFEGVSVIDIPLEDDILAKNDFSLFYENHDNGIKFLFRYKKAKYSLNAAETIKNTFVALLAAG